MDGIKTLRASGSQLQADVVVGSNQYGSDVAVQVKLDRKDPELVAALEPLMTLLSTRAQGHLVDVHVEREVQQRVREQVSTRLSSERTRLTKEANDRVTTLVAALRKQIGFGEQALEPFRVRQLLEVLNREGSTAAEKVVA